MKPSLLILWLLLAVLVAACSAVPLGTKSNDARVQDRLESLFAACQAQDHAAAAEAIVYRGDDTTRRWKALSNYDNADEKRHVDQVCGEIRALLAGSDAYTWGEYLEETESEGTWHVQAVQFVKDLQRQERHFAFLMIGDVFALGDID